MKYDQEMANIFLSNFGEAYRSGIRLQQSQRRLSKYMPLNVHVLESVDEELSEKLDAFRVRFGDVQDVLGNKVFKSLLLLEEERVTSPLDTLNQMEKRGVIETLEAWTRLRKMRNNFAHDYPNSSKEISDALNTAYEMTSQLLMIIDTLAQYAADLGLPLEEYSPVLPMRTA